MTTALSPQISEPFTIQLPKQPSPRLGAGGTATTSQPFQVVRGDGILCPPCALWSPGLIRQERTREGQVHDGAGELEGSSGALGDWDLLSYQVW